MSKAFFFEIIVCIVCQYVKWSNWIQDEETLQRHHRHAGTTDPSHVFYISRHAGSLLLLRYHWNGTVWRLRYEELLQVSNVVAIKDFEVSENANRVCTKMSRQQGLISLTNSYFWFNLQTSLKKFTFL